MEKNSAYDCETVFHLGYHVLHEPFPRPWSPAVVHVWQLGV